jgi:DNA-binding transcriptional MerR regulator
MPQARPQAPVELTYPLRTATRLTGLSPSLLRAWERRYGVVTPIRTPGGTRRYRAADLERLRLLKAAVDAGHRIGRIVGLGPRELEHLLTVSAAPEASGQAAILDALEQLEGVESQRLLSLQLSALGPMRFARGVALPLLREIGERWASRQLTIASEHLASSVLRSMLGSALQPSAASLLGPRIVFATPSGERHELGLQMAAIAALGASANPVYLGAELPVEEMLGAVERCGAAALALSVVTLPVDQTRRTLAALRGGLPASVHVFIGGAAAGGALPLAGVEHIESLEALEQRVALLGFERGR